VVIGVRRLCKVVQRREKSGGNRQFLDGFCGSTVKKLALSGLQPLADVLDGRERLERARDELRPSAPARLVGTLRLDELGVGENDPQLIVQSVKEQGQIGVIVHGE
jgi:hypothetical protein